jgi:hypothetical protein
MRLTLLARGICPALIIVVAKGIVTEAATQ